VKKLLAFLIVISCSFALAGEKGNGNDPIGQVDEVFENNSDSLCREFIAEKNSEDETVEFFIDDETRTYNRVAIRNYCCSLNTGPACMEK